jgi:hypothetical protein
VNLSSHFMAWGGECESKVILGEKKEYANGRVIEYG